MVRAILAPKSLENQFVKRVWEKQDNGLVKEVLTQFRGNTLCVCLCEDGRAEYESVAESIRFGLQSLYEMWHLSVEIAIEDFSFGGDPVMMGNLLSRSDLFYFAGVHEIDPDVQHQMRYGPLLPLLQDRIQYNQCTFYGVCGGAMLAGAGEKYGVPGLDIFGGCTVRYDFNAAAKHVAVDTNAQQRIIQITSGCGVVVIMDPVVQIGVSFPTVKNHRKWWDFADQSTLQLKKVIALKVSEWQPCSHGEVVWYFNIMGMISYYQLRPQLSSSASSSSLISV